MNARVDKKLMTSIGLGLAVVLSAAAGAQSAVSPLTQPRTTSPACRQDAVRKAACDVVVRFFGARPRSHLPGFGASASTTRAP